MVSLLSPSPVSVTRAMDSISGRTKAKSGATTAKSGSTSNAILFT